MKQSIVSDPEEVELDCKYNEWDDSGEFSNPEGDMVKKLTKELKD